MWLEKIIVRLQFFIKVNFETLLKSFTACDSRNFIDRMSFSPNNKSQNSKHSLLARKWSFEFKILFRNDWRSEQKNAFGKYFWIRNALKKNIFGSNWRNMYDLFVIWSHQIFFYFIFETLFTIFKFFFSSSNHNPSSWLSFC